MQQTKPTTSMLPFPTPIKMDAPNTKGPSSHVSNDKSFDLAFAQAQAGSGIPEQHAGETSKDNMVKPELPLQEEEADPAEQKLVIPMIAPLVQAVMNMPEAVPPAQDAIEAVDEGPIAQPQIPSLQSTQDLPTMDLPAPQPEIGVSIPEGQVPPAIAQVAAETLSTAIAPKPEQNVAVAPLMEEAVAPKAKAVQGEATARMPKDSILASLERDEPVIQTILSQDSPSSFENADTQEQEPAPPSRVETSNIKKLAADALEEQSAIKPTTTSFAPALGAENAAGEKAQLPPVQQISQEIQVQSAMGKQSFTMKLKPEGLGDVTVRLIIMADGIAARIVTGTEEARLAIVNQAAVLEAELKGKGIDIRSVEVMSGEMNQTTLMHDGSKHDGSQPQQQQKRQRGMGAIDQIDAAEAVSDYNAWLYGPDAVDIDAENGVEYNA